MTSLVPQSSATAAFVGSCVIQRASMARVWHTSTSSCWPSIATSTAGTGIPLCRARRRRRRDNDDDDDELEVSADLPLEVAVDQIIGVFASPTPLGVSVGYPLFLGILGLVLPLSTWILSWGFFLGYSYLGSMVVGDDRYEDDDTLETTSNFIMSLLSVAGAIASAGLISPDGLVRDGGALGSALLAQLFGISLIGLAGASLLPIAGSSSSHETMTDDTVTLLEDEMLKQWDARFAKDESRLDED